MGRVVVAVPHGQRPTLGEWREGSGCSGRGECQIGCWRQLWVHLTLRLAKGKVHGGAFACWRTIPFAHLFAAGFLHGAAPYLLWHPRK